MTAKLTRHQRSIAEFLTGSSGFLSAQEIHSALRSAGSTVGLATVYRSVQVLADHDLLDVIRTPEGEARYRACSPGHHHHLVCRSCGLAVELEAAAVEAWAAQAGAQQGFSEITHDVELFGVCPSCIRRRQP